MSLRSDNLADRFEVSIANEQTTHAINEQQLVAAVEAVLRDSQFQSAAISLAVVDDQTMHELNRQYLEHDYPTDVLSFVLEEDDTHLEGEVIISTDTAASFATEFNWPAAAEQLLYVIHGTLHLVGYRDKATADIQEMRAAEEKYLREFGFERLEKDSGCGTQDTGSDSGFLPLPPASSIPRPSAANRATSGNQRGTKE